MRYNPQLDGLRALAAIIVVAFHAKVPQLSGGFLGVDVFFVLSGYLITKLLIEEKNETTEINYKHFITKRLWRLYPALLTLIIIYLILAPILFPEYELMEYIQEAVLSGLYLSDYALIFDIPINLLKHTWSLSAEMQFYLLWPLILLLVLKSPKEHVQLALLLLWIASTFWRIYVYYWLEVKWDIYYRADTHCSGLLLGAFLSTIKVRQSRIITISGLTLLAYAIVEYEWRMKSTPIFGFSLAEIGAGMIIAAPPAWMGKGVLPWVGKMSYGLYLWHYPVIQMMKKFEVNWQVTFLIGICLGMFFATISYYLIEQPLLKRKFKYSGINLQK